MTATSAPDLRPDHHRRPPQEVAAAFDVDPDRGLSAEEVVRRREAHGRNELDEAPRTPTWRRLLDQFRDVLILILIGAAVVSYVASGELKTPLVVLVVVVLNAVISFVQENRAEASLDALRGMLVIQVTARRDGEWQTVTAEELVPGDVVAVEAGDRVPADGRFLTAVQLEIEEAALTGESVPTSKSTAAIDEDDVGLGDRHGSAFMNTTVTRGRGEMVVTATGMDTEIGRIAGMLRAAPTEKTPLQRQLDGLAHSLAKLALVIVSLVFAIGLLRGEAVADLFLTAVALSVASIPEGLPAVTAVTLAVGVSRMADRNAIVKRLASVETLGCTNVVCSDKTGTLTLNEMTAVELVVGGESLPVSGTGYSPEGDVDHGSGSEERWLGEVMLALALCSDATIRQGDGGEWELVGDPTEGALVTLAAKDGCDVGALRGAWPRVAEVPFDSAHKYMATVHDPPDDDPAADDDGIAVRLFVKGAPDALLERSLHVAGPDGELLEVDRLLSEIHAHNDRMAGEGRRVLAVAWRDIPPAEWEDLDPTDVMHIVRDLTFGALVGIVDPPRPEARDAVEEARRAGIQVKMITGDHAATAVSIGESLGLADPGEPVVAVTGRDIDAMSDEELASRIDEISVFARVAPEHKLRLVAAFQHRGDVVAMTGDGVNDAPALRQADMGIAMGITGTEVTKEAATMVLADDNFATIVEAVRRGRTIYDNIVKFVRFQLSTTLGFAAVFLAASVLGIASGQPFTAIAILWVNIIMDGPPAMALGLDRGDVDIMERSPRPRDERILTRERWGAVGFAAVVMAVGTLGVLAWGPGEAARAGEATVAGTMAFNTFVLFQFFNILNVRSERQSVFHRQTLRNRHLWVALGGVLVLQVAVVHIGPLQRLFDMTSISAAQWAVCVAVASTVLLAEELRKVVLRRRDRD